MFFIHCFVLLPGYVKSSHIWTSLDCSYGEKKESTVIRKGVRQNQRSKLKREGREINKKGEEERGERREEKGGKAESEIKEETRTNINPETQR